MCLNRAGVNKLIIEKIHLKVIVINILGDMIKKNLKNYLNITKTNFSLTVCVLFYVFPPSIKDEIDILKNSWH